MTKKPIICPKASLAIPTRAAVRGSSLIAGIEIAKKESRHTALFFLYLF